MDKDEVLKIAQETNKDERNETITIKAHRIAGNISMLLACLLALVIIIDGYVFESNRNFDFLTVAFMLIGVGAVNNAAFSIYQLIALKKYSRIIDVIVFGALAISSVVKTVLFFLH